MVAQSHQNEITNVVANMPITSQWARTVRPLFGPASSPRVSWAISFLKSSVPVRKLCVGLTAATDPCRLQDQALVKLRLVTLFDLLFERRGIRSSNLVGENATERRKCAFGNTLIRIP
jgi:hypothetical protein